MPSDYACRSLCVKRFGFGRMTVQTRWQPGEIDEYAVHAARPGDAASSLLSRAGDWMELAVEVHETC